MHVYWTEISYDNMHGNASVNNACNCGNLLLESYLTDVDFVYRQINLRREDIRDVVWKFTRGNNSARKRLDPELSQKVLKLFNSNRPVEPRANQPRTFPASLQDLLRSANDVNNNGFTKMQSLYPSCK